MPAAPHQPGHDDLFAVDGSEHHPALRPGVDVPAVDHRHSAGRDVARHHEVRADAPAGLDHHHRRRRGAVGLPRRLAGVLSAPQRLLTVEHGEEPMAFLHAQPHHVEELAAAHRSSALRAAPAPDTVSASLDRPTTIAASVRVELSINPASPPEAPAPFLRPPYPSPPMSPDMRAADRPIERRPSRPGALHSPVAHTHLADCPVSHW